MCGKIAGKYQRVRKQGKRGIMCGKIAGKYQRVRKQAKRVVY